MRTYIIKDILPLLTLVFTLATNGYAQSIESTHTVKPGETLYAISKMYGVTINSIKDSNPDISESLKAGTKLTIPTSGNNSIYYTIQPKETLYSISKKYNIDSKLITSANPGLSETNFRIGTTIKIPISRFVETKVDTTTRKPAGIAGSNCREIYKTGKNETLETIADKYKVSINELITANPELKNKVDKKLSKGTFLCIPFSLPQTQNNENIQNKVQQSTKESVLKKKNDFNIVLLMPFFTDQNKSVEFYRGFLYAINELKKHGISFGIEAYNAGQSVTDINKIMSKESIAQADLIISCGSEAVSNIISDYCEQHKIKMLLPFSNAFDAVYDNPYVILSNMPQSYENAAYTNYFLTSLPANANVVFFECVKQSDLSKSILRELYSRNIQYNIVGASSSIADFQSAFKNDVPNVIFISSPLKADYEAMRRMLEKCSTQLNNKNFSIFGYDTWKDFDTPTRNTFFNYGVTICTSQFINVYAKDYSSSRLFYIDTFKKTPSVYTQRNFYAGYDCANTLFGTNESSLSKPFAFKRVNTWGGMINNGIRIVTFTKKNTTVISDYEN